MSDATQMNVRLSTDLKTRGDAALQAAGLTPSAAVRALWQFAADHEHEPLVIAEEVARLEGDSSGVKDELRRRLDAYGRARTVFSDRMAGLGVSCEAGAPACAGSVGEASVGELREEALLERMADRGLA